MHIGIFRNEKLTCAMSFLVATVNNMPANIAVSVEFMAKAEDEGSAGAPSP